MLWKQELAVPAPVARDACTDVAVVPFVARGAVVARVVLAAIDG